MPKRATPPQDVTDGTTLLTPAEVGRRIGRSRATVYRLIESGRIETVTLPVAKPGEPKDGKPAPTGAVRVPVAALERFNASLRRSEAS
jgi:hypothetical protein